MGGIIGGIISAIGSMFGGFFKAKEKQGEVIAAGLEAVDALAKSKSQSDSSAALVVAAEATSESILARNWRPLMMIIFMSLIVARFFGWVSPHMTPAEYERLWDLMEIGMGGYIGSRTIEKIVGQLNLGSTLRKYIEQLTTNKQSSRNDD